MKQIETNDATPEELVRILDAQIENHRLQRVKSSRNRAIVLAFGIFIIVFGAGGALLVLDRMLLDFRQGERAAGMVSSRPLGNF